MRMRFMTGLAGERLGDAERCFLRDSEPAGLILFTRNCRSREQVRRLVGEALDAVGHDDTLVAIDQEGGRVQRLLPPEWRAYPPMAAFGRWYEQAPETATEAARRVASLIAADLTDVGCNMNCVPVLDLPARGADPIIGPRAFSTVPEVVAALGAAIADGCRDGGVCPVGKHVPGHGRATADSHVSLPVVDADRDELEGHDFVPFRMLARLPAMMTAHVLYSKIDDGRPASQSAFVHSDIIRGAMGFNGLLISDDLSMGALEGPMDRRAEAVIAAGTDIALHCNGTLAEMEAVATAVPRLEGDARQRAEACFQATRFGSILDREAALDALREALTFADGAASR